MGKYLIQDIIPPDRKRHKVPIERHHTPAHHHAATAAHVENEHHENEPRHAPSAHHAMTEANLTEDSSIPDIHEHNETHAHHTDEIAESASGAWPYNNETPPAETPSPSWKTHLPPILPLTPQTPEGVKGGWLPWIVGPLGILGALALVFNFFFGATVSITEKSETVPIEQKFTAAKNPTTGELAYAVMKIDESDSTEVPATGTKTVTTKASGKIIIYNEQSAPQRLIKNTRFESLAGKVYRINESVTIPKQSAPQKPGSLQITVYADEAGPEYNTAPTDFTLPGLKETPQAKKVYARSSAEIAGGASGTTKSVSDQDLVQATNNLRVSLETKLRNKARGSLAPSQIAYDQSILLDLKEPALSNEKATSDTKAVVTETGTLFMVVFDRSALTKAIAKSAVPTYNNEDIIIRNIDGLVFAMDPESGDTLWSSPTLNFSLQGSPELNWIVDQVTIKNALLGLPKADFNAKMGQYSTVLRAKASIHPFWKQHFPVDPKSITIKIVPNISE